MRKLSQIVVDSGIAPFTRDDFYLISNSVSIDPGRLVLVGGQALEAWGALLDVQAPSGNLSPLTEDTDWLGTAADAQWLASLLRNQAIVELNQATLDDSTPSSALMLIQFPDGRIVMMDFLHSIIGLEDDEIRTLAVAVTLPSNTGTPVTIRVLHPLHCLISRMANLKVLPEKRKGNGPLQAAWAIDIARAFLLNLVEQGCDEKQVRNACHRIAKIAEFGAAEYCYVNFSVDPLQAVTQEIVAAGGTKFAGVDWPKTVQRVEGKRQKWLRKVRAPAQST